MNYSPGDIFVYEAPLAGRGINKMKLDFIMNTPVDVAGNGMATISSPPLLDTRSSPRRLTVTSPETDNSPMHTPSPSLMRQSNTPHLILYLPAPAAPNITITPRSPQYGCIPASTAIHEGLNLLALDEESPITGHPLAPHQEQSNPILGLGYGLPGYDSDELIAVLPGLHSPGAPRAARLQSGLGLGLDVTGWDDDDLITVMPGSNHNSPPHSPVSTSAERIGLGFDLLGYDDENLIVDELDEALDSPADSPMPAYYNLLIGASQRGTRPARPPLRRPPLRRSSIDDDNVCTPPSTLSPAMPTNHTNTSNSDAEESSYAQVRGLVGLGLQDSDGELMTLQGTSTIENHLDHSAPLSNSPLSGTDSPFWETYVMVVSEEERTRKEERRKLLSRLPIIEGNSSLSGSLQ